MFYPPVLRFNTMDLHSFATYGFNDTCTNITPNQTTAEHYWNYSAQLKQSAWILTGKIDTKFPVQVSSVFVRTVMHPLYRLVVTGQDTPDNMALLLGPTWEEDTARPHLICRLLVLMPPEPGSVPFRVANILDERGRCTEIWKPRMANEAEAALLRRIKWENTALTFAPAPALAVEFLPGTTWQTKRESRLRLQLLLRKRFLALTAKRASVEGWPAGLYWLYCSAVEAHISGLCRILV